MGTGQYKFWINESRLNLKQKKMLGWVPQEKEPDRSADLFTKFTALGKWETVPLNVFGKPPTSIALGTFAGVCLSK